MFDRPSPVQELSIIFNFTILLNFTFLHWWDCTDLGLIDMFSTNQNAEISMCNQMVTSEIRE